MGRGRRQPGRPRRRVPAPRRAQPARGRRLLPRLRQLAAVAAVPRAPPPARDEPHLVARVPGRERALRRDCRPDRAAQRTGVGPRLPPAADAGDDPRSPTRPADRVVPAHPVPVGRPVRDAAVARRPGARHEQRRPARIPDRARRRQRHRRDPSVRGRSPPLESHPRSWRGRDRRRSRSRSTSSTGRRSASKPPTAPRGDAPSSASSSCSPVSTGSTTPRASTSACGRSGSCSTSGLLDPRTCCFVQVSVPSREEIFDYGEQRDEVEWLVADINERHGARRPRSRYSTSRRSSTRASSASGTGPPIASSSRRTPTA